MRSSEEELDVIEEDLLELLSLQVVVDIDSEFEHVSAHWLTIAPSQLVELSLSQFFTLFRHAVEMRVRELLLLIVEHVDVHVSSVTWQVFWLLLLFLLFLFLNLLFFVLIFANFVFVFGHFFLLNLWLWRLTLVKLERYGV